MSYIETGHAKNIAHFEEMTIIIPSFGTRYNPSRTAIQLPQLQTKLTAAQQALDKVTSTNQEFNRVTNYRSDAFEVLRPLATAIVNALIASEASTETIKDAKGFQRKIQGRRALTSKVPPVDPDIPAPVSISASQQSYDQLIQHLSGLIEVVKREPNYTPNETDLQVATLQTKIADLTAKNTAVATAYASISNSRIARNETLYSSSTGLVETANEVKKYIKSVFGASSPQFAQVKGIQFKIIKN